MIIKLNKVMVILSAVALCPSVYAETAITPPTNYKQTTVKTANNVMVEDAIKSALPPQLKNISVTVTNEVAYLSGEVNSDMDFEHAVTIAQSIPGVSDVDTANLIVQKSHRSIADTYLTAKIKGTFLRADVLGEKVPMWSVHVETKDGIVYLSGTVASSTEKQTLLDLTRSIKGVHEVDDRITIAGDGGS